MEMYVCVWSGSVVVWDIDNTPVFKEYCKGKGQDTCYSAAYMSQTCDQQRFYNLASGSWLAWANGAAAHYVAIHCPC